MTLATRGKFLTGIESESGSLATKSHGNPKSPPPKTMQREKEKPNLFQIINLELRRRRCTHIQEVHSSEEQQNRSSSSESFLRG